MNGTRGSLCCKFACEIKCEAEIFRIKRTEFVLSAVLLLQMLCTVMHTGVRFLVSGSMAGVAGYPSSCKLCVW